MKNLYKASFLFLILSIIVSCNNDDEVQPADLSPPELTYLQINGEDINDDHIHVSAEEDFSIRFSFRDNERIMEGDFRLVINDSEALSKTIDYTNNNNSSNYKYTFTLPHLKEFNNLNGTDIYNTQPNDQIEFIITTKDPSENVAERTIKVMLF